MPLSLGGYVSDKVFPLESRPWPYAVLQTLREHSGCIFTMVPFPFPLPETQGNVTSFLSSFLPFFSFPFFFLSLYYENLLEFRGEIQKRLQLPEISHSPDIHVQSPAIHPHSRLQTPGADGPGQPIKLGPASPVCIRSHLVPASRSKLEGELRIPWVRRMQ